MEIGIDQIELAVHFTRDVYQVITNYDTVDKKNNDMTNNFSDRLSNYVEAKGFE